MFLLPFGQNYKSYTANPEEDKSAQKELKRWVNELKESKKIVDKIHEETLNEVGETFQ